MNFIQKLVSKIFKKGKKVDEAAVAYIDITDPTEQDIAFIEQNNESTTETTEQTEQLEVKTPTVVTEPVEGVVEDSITTKRAKTQASFNKIVRAKYKGKQNRLAKRSEQLATQKIEAEEAIEKYDGDAYVSRLITADQKSINVELARIGTMQTVSEEEFNHYMQLKSERHAYGELIKMLIARKKALGEQMAACSSSVKEFAKGVSPVLPSDLAETAKSIEEKVSVEINDDDEHIID